MRKINPSQEIHVKPGDPLSQSKERHLLEQGDYRGVSQQHLLRLVVDLQATVGVLLASGLLQQGVKPGVIVPGQIAARFLGTVKIEVEEIIRVRVVGIPTQAEKRVGTRADRGLVVLLGYLFQL